jgi:FkbM family methyltransferase
MYSQNNEKEILLTYFKDFTGVLLDIGANDGKTFSNSLALINYGWQAVLIEPSQSAFDKLEALHYDNEKVDYYNIAIGTVDGKATFHNMGTHLGKDDTSLLSTLVAGEMDRWKGTEFKDEEVEVLTYATFMDEAPHEHFDFITIDAEGMDLAILEQIDLTHAQAVCIEHNSNEVLYGQMVAYCSKFGLNKILLNNLENVIVAR